jgi:asparagine synthase (glutamine-hydrolysing)
MCGIAGVYGRRGRPIVPSLIVAQCDALRHRGPDDTGTFVDGDFGFGMRRLSILDIAGGHQPMEDERYAIIFNGEIYNHQQLRAPLIAAGYRFRSRSDTETILAAFGHWGDGAWAKLEGMFAVAIWDRQLRQLTLARDPLGIKPLYLSEQNGGLAFASEIKALRVLPGYQFEPDDRAVHDFFSFGHVRKPRSIYRQVSSLEPGQTLTIGPTGGARTTSFWQPRFTVGEHRSVEDWTDAMRSMLLDTTARHMQSDVPVGVFLSGGVDSSAILAAMAKATDRPIKAFTVGHPGAKIDETAAAAEIARYLGCEHIIMPLDADEAIRTLPDILSCYDEPFADLAAIPTWFISKLAAEHVKVVLCGEGGDELFAGYKRHRNARAIERFRSLLRALTPLSSALARLPSVGSKRGNYFLQNARRVGELIRLPDGYQQFFAATQTSSRSTLGQIYCKDFKGRNERLDDFALLEAEYFPAEVAEKRTALERFLFADLTLNMPSAMLPRLDRASMAHSLEARVPFLSHRMVDFALSVPESMKLRGATGKFILRNAVSPWLPPSVMSRPKQGFQVPHAAWFQGKLGNVAQEMWHASGASNAGYLEATTVDRLFSEHRHGQANHARLLYAAAVFATWWQNSHAGIREAVA